VTAFTSSLDEEDVYLLARTYNDKVISTSLHWSC
jgi:hypothetical protein